MWRCWALANSLGLLSQLSNKLFLLQRTSSNRQEAEFGPAALAQPRPPDLQSAKQLNGQRRDPPRESHYVFSFGSIIQLQRPLRCLRRSMFAYVVWIPPHNHHNERISIFWAACFRPRDGASLPRRAAALAHPPPQGSEVSHTMIIIALYVSSGQSAALVVVARRRGR